jgi:hypothetical protein
MNNIFKRVLNWENVKKVMKNSATGALIGTLVAFLLVFYFYQAPQLELYHKQLDLYQKQLDIMNETLSTQNESLSVQHEQIAIMNESLLKRVQLALEVIPRYEWKVHLSSDGSMQLTNITLTVPRNEQTVFHVYVSNLGNAIAHLLYWTVTIFAPPNTIINSGPVYDIQNIVLASYGLYNMTYTFDPSGVSTFINGVVFTFALMSTESIVYQTVNATFR